MKISLTLIVKDEEEVLGRCLESVSDLVDEIVVVDTGSKDATKEIARKYTDLIFDFPWRDDFSAARNFALQKASCDYALWLDADDIIPEKSRKIFPSLKEQLSALPDFVMCRYELGEKAEISFFRERVIKLNAGHFFRGRVHECIQPSGKIVYSDFSVTHLRSKKERAGRNLAIYQKWKKEEALSPRDLFYYGRELYYERLFEEAIAVLEEMLRGDGFYVNKIDACKTIGLCYLEKQNFEKAIEAFLKSFLYGEPRASLCCEIGKAFRRQKKYKEAAFWFETALKAKDHSKEGDFEEPNTRSIDPLLELVCCYYALGDLQTSIRYHKKTEEIAPDHPSVVYNRKFFSLKARDLL